MLKPEEAWSRLLPHLDTKGTENVPRRQGLGRVLSRQLRATVDVPFADVSAMDGYAVAGPVEAGERRVVTATIAAGDAPGLELAPGQTARIMTGAPVPRGADRVAPVELTDGGDREVLFASGVEAGAHLRRGGEIVRRGDALLPSDIVLTPRVLALLATHGYSEVPVYCQPRVAVLTTGDEVVPAESTPGPGQLRDSHTDFLLAAGRNLGLRFRSLGTAPDRRDALEEHIARGLEHDVLLVCGGVSKGEHDLVEGVLAKLGCQILFDSVAIQPGKPLVAAVRSSGEKAGTLVFGLPGNPASVMTCFRVFARPALRRLMGMTEGYLDGAVWAEVTAPLPGTDKRDRFITAELRWTPRGFTATPLLPRGSHDLLTYARGDALLRIAAHSAPAPAGSQALVLPLS